MVSFAPDRHALADRIVAVLELAAPRGAGYWRGCVSDVEVHAGWSGSNWTIRALATPEDMRLIGLTASLVRSGFPQARSAR